MKTKGLIFFALLAVLGGSTLVWGGENGARSRPAAPAKAVPSYIGIEERLGAVVPLDLMFTDESGQPVRLRELVTKPTIVSFVYYTCTDVCPLLLSGLAEVLEKLPAEPGTDYAVLTVSFDEIDTPAKAAEKKENYLKALGQPFPDEAWRFVIGDRANIRQLAEAVGFRFKREGEIFLHPVALFVLSPEGRVARYLYGNRFLPFDLKLALLEAREGRVGPTISKVLKYCFTYDPKGRTYVFNILRVFATTMVVFLVGLFIFLTRTGKRRKRKEGND
ncbi:MAG: SCO family protein [Nitrospinota bacterium]